MVGGLGSQVWGSDLCRLLCTPPRLTPAHSRKTLRNSRIVSQKDDVHVCIMCLRAIMNYQVGQPGRFSPGPPKLLQFQDHLCSAPAPHWRTWASGLLAQGLEADSLEGKPIFLNLPGQVF